MQVLCATDLTSSSHEIADVAAALAAKMKLPLRLVHCSPDWVAMGELAVDIRDDSEARQQMLKEVERLRETGVEVSFEMRRGNAAAQVTAAAIETATRLIVLGKVEARFPEPSVVEWAARSAPVPTLIVREPAPLLAWLRGQEVLPVLCAVDFTLTADAALSWMKQLQSLGPIELSAGYISTGLQQLSDAEARANFQRDVWDRLRTALGDVPELADLPVKIHVKPAQRRPAEDFVQLAQETGASLIAAGAHQYGGWRRLLKGSFSQSVVHHAHTNVLCIPAVTYNPPQRLPAIHRVLVATDFSDSGNAAIPHAFSLVRSGDAVRLLHVCRQVPPGMALAAAAEGFIETDTLTEAQRQAAEEKLQALVPRRMATSDIAITFEVVAAADVASAIRDAAGRFGADAICMGTTGHSRARIALLGSTLQSVMAHSHTPVFAVTPLAK